MKKLNEMTSAELKKLGKENGVKNWWKMNKSQLIEALENPQPKLKFKDACEECEKFDYLSNFHGRLLCEKCIEKHENEQAEQTETVEPVEEIDIPTPLDPVPSVTVTVMKPKKSKREVKGRKMIEYNGKSQHIVAWARELGINANTLYNRIYYKGMTMEEAINAPIKRGRPKKASK